MIPRVETIAKLVRLLEEYTVVHVRGTTVSGKSWLTDLLETYYSRHGKPALFIITWPDSPNLLEYLAERCRRAGDTDVNSDNIPGANIFFILDEAQCSYFVPAFWLSFIKTQNRRRCGDKMCLFASFGSSVTDPTEYPGGSFPVYFSPEQRALLTVSSVPGTPDICLFHNREEFDDVLQRYSVLHKMSCELTPDARDYLYSIRSEHPGAVSSLERYFSEVCILRYHHVIRKLIS